jgi:hypothetical protein
VCRRRSILDHERLAQPLGELLANQPAQHIGAAAGAKGTHEIHLAIGIVCA